MHKQTDKLLIVLLMVVVISSTISTRKYSKSHAQRASKFLDGKKSWLRQFMVRNAVKQNDQNGSQRYFSTRQYKANTQESQSRQHDQNIRPLKLAERLSLISEESLKKVKSSFNHSITTNSSIKTGDKRKKKLTNIATDIHMQSQLPFQSADRKPKSSMKKINDIISQVKYPKYEETAFNKQTADHKNFKKSAEMHPGQKTTNPNSLLSKAEIDTGIVLEAPAETTDWKADNAKSNMQPSASIKFTSNNSNMVYEAGDFNNTHISQLLMAVADIELYFTTLFYAMQFQEKDMKEETDHPTKFPKTHLDVLMAVILRDSTKVKGSIVELEERIESIQLNFHNVLDFFELKNEFEDIKVKAGFDHEVLEDMENRLLKEVNNTADKFRVLKTYLHNLETSYKNLLSFISTGRKSRLTAANPDGSYSEHASLNKAFVSLFERLRLSLMASLKNLKDQVFLIKQQKIVFDKVFNESKNAIQISRATNSNWIYPITIVLITVSTALLI